MVKEKTLVLIKPDGFVILHDSGRLDYRGMIADFPGRNKKIIDTQIAHFPKIASIISIIFLSFTILI